MRRARFDGYEFPSFRSILGSTVLWCTALVTAGLGLFYFEWEDLLRLVGYHVMFRGIFPTEYKA